MNKRKIYMLGAIILFIGLMAITGRSGVDKVKAVSNNNVELKKYLLSGAKMETKDAKKMAKKIGGMNKKKNKYYTDYYVVGNSMTIGCNSEIELYDSKEVRKNYTYIKNKGNKNVSMYGVKIGMSLTTARRLLQKESFTNSDSDKRTETFWFGDAACVKITKKNKKVRTITYICAPTG